MEAWRIVKSRHIDTAFSGDGSEKYGGRWNSPGRRVVYASSSQSLAALETHVHLNPAIPLDYVIFRIRFPASLAARITLPDLPPGWREEPPPPACQAIGDRWIATARHAILRVPSALVPDETNFLLNPAHPDFPKIEIGTPQPFRFDPRLI